MESRPSLPIRDLLGVVAGTLVGVALLIATPAPAVGQEKPPDRPKANPEDVKSPEAIVEATREAISGPAAERDWDRFRSLFLPQAHVVAAIRENGEPRRVEFTVEEYISTVEKQYPDTAVYESGIHTITERFGDIAHVWTTYEIRRHSPDAEPFRRGVASYQLWYDGERWWVRNIVAHAAPEGTPIPERYGG